MLLLLLLPLLLLLTHNVLPGSCHQLHLAGVRSSSQQDDSNTNRQLSGQQALSHHQRLRAWPSPHSHRRCRRQLSSILQCETLSTEYHPSRHERNWTDHVHLWGSSATPTADYCQHLAESVPEVERVLARVKTLMAALMRDAVTSSDLKLLSHYTHIMDCGSGGGDGRKTLHRHYSLIEPLIGGLRHPHYPCKNVSYLLDKKYLLLASAYSAPWFHSAVAKVFVFDLGASLYRSGLGGTSQEWFVNTLRSRGFEPDQYFAWEVIPRSDDVVLADVPGWLLPRYHYFNVPAPTGVEDPANPFNILKRIATKDDYVLVKLDIDNAEVEMRFIRQLLGDTNISSLIDEFFFEHHVHFQPMYNDWVLMDGELKDSYDIFTRLRHLGVRAHGWV